MPDHTSFDPSANTALPSGEPTPGDREHPRRFREPASPLDELELAFRALTTGPAPLALDGRRIGRGLPRRRVPLDGLRVLLLHPSTGYPLRDAVWAELVRRAQTREPEWVVGAAGMALPGLYRVAGQLSRGHARLAEDLDAEILTGFLQALRTVDPDAGRLPSRLCWAAFRAGLALLERELAFPPPMAEPPDTAAPMLPWGHPDLVLADLVRAGVIAAEDAALIGSTRLEDTTLAEAARTLGISTAAAKMRRYRAENLLIAALTDQTGADAFTDPAATLRDDVPELAAYRNRRATGQRTRRGAYRPRPGARHRPAAGESAPGAVGAKNSAGTGRISGGHVEASPAAGGGAEGLALPDTA
jgi:hypothetical protein